MTTRNDGHIGLTEYTYTKEQLENLKECLELNQGNLSAALRAFLSRFENGDTGNKVLDLWLPLAERIANDPDFINKHFTQISKESLVERHLIE